MWVSPGQPIVQAVHWHTEIWLTLTPERDFPGSFGGCQWQIKECGQHLLSLGKTDPGWIRSHTWMSGSDAMDRVAVKSGSWRWCKQTLRRLLPPGFGFRSIECGISRWDLWALQFKSLAKQNKTEEDKEVVYRMGNVDRFHGKQTLKLPVESTRMNTPTTAQQMFYPLMELI